MEDYIKLNRATWNKKVPVHLESEFYAHKAFLSGKSSLNEIELELLGDVKDKSILHLQCHFGQDTISLSRMGAAVTGIDFSDRAIDTARDITQTVGATTKFLCSDVYDLPNKMAQKFDIVFSSYGTIGWLPDIVRWAQVVSHFLKPGGHFVFVEFHPVIWMFDEHFKEITYSYFKRNEIIESFEGTYAEPTAPIAQTTITWNHGLAEVLQALIDQGLSIEDFREYDYSPYDCFNGTVEVAPGKFRIATMGDKLPMLYGLKANKA
jgi:SAM-dependent methyltransferase